MVEVEDKSEMGTEPISVSGGTDDDYTDHVTLKSASGETYIHKDTWPALKEAIETTFKQMEAKPLLMPEDRAEASKILLKALEDTLSISDTLDALERGYV